MYFGPLLYFIVVNIVLRFVYEHKEYQVNIIPVFLSITYSSNVCIYVKQVGRYIIKWVWQVSKNSVRFADLEKWNVKSLR